MKRLLNFHLGVCSPPDTFYSKHSSSCALCFLYHIILFLFQLMFAVCYSYLLALLGFWVLFLQVESISFGSKILVQSTCPFLSLFSFFSHYFVWLENWFLTLHVISPPFCPLPWHLHRSETAFWLLLKLFPVFSFLSLFLAFVLYKEAFCWCVYKHLSFCGLCKYPFPFL